MNRFSRMLIMSGLGLATTLSLGLSPANPAMAAGHGTSPAMSAGNRHDDDDWEFKGWYYDEDDCEDAGRRGERRGWWEDSYCRELRRGYALWVQEDDDRGHHRHHGRHHRH